MLKQLGWSRKDVAKYIMLTGSVVPEVLKMANEHQQGRGTSIVPFGTTFNFTEGWYRYSNFGFRASREACTIKWYKCTTLQPINEVIMPDILKMALEHQKGRGIDEYAQGHNFTERWFRGTNPR